MYVYWYSGIDVSLQTATHLSDMIFIGRREFYLECVWYKNVVPRKNISMKISEVIKVELSPYR